MKLDTSPVTLVEDGQPPSMTDIVIDQLKRAGYQIIEPEPESFVRKINGREAILVRSRL